MHDQLADQAVVIGRDRIAAVQGRIHPHTQAAGRVKDLDPTGARRKIGQTFGVDAHFDGMAVDLQLVLGEGQRQSRSNADLFAHKVDAKDRFGDRVFHLQTGVHLDEKEFAVFV